MNETMTAEQAIAKLTNIMHDDHYSWHPSILEAFRMAVDALKGAEGECISRQAAINAIRIGALSTAMIYGRTDEGMTARREIERAINELPSAQPAQRWIPWDSGEFPEESGTYIVTAYDGVTKRVTFAKYQKRLKRWELTGARAYWRVLAWMPLPEPARLDGE